MECERHACLRTALTGFALGGLRLPLKSKSTSKSTARVQILSTQKFRVLLEYVQDFVLVESSTGTGKSTSTLFLKRVLYSSSTSTYVEYKFSYSSLNFFDFCRKLTLIVNIINDLSKIFGFDPGEYRKKLKYPGVGTSTFRVYLASTGTIKVQVQGFYF